MLARDPFGVRPLYFTINGGRLYFGSEVKAIFAADHRLPRAFDPIGLQQVFTFWTHVAPRTVFAGVEELPAGCTRVYRGRRYADSWASTSSFPETPEGGFQGSLDDAVDAVKSALQQATELRMLRADVPVGSYLSGGLDSSLVASLGLRAKGSKFNTFSLRFEDAEYDETLVSAADGRIPRQRAPRDRGDAGRHRCRVPRSGATRGASHPPYGPSTVVPAVRSRQKSRHQGRADGRGRRRDVCRLRPLPGSEGAPILGPPSDVDNAASPPRASLPVSRPIARLAEKTEPAVLRARPRAPSRTRVRSRHPLEDDERADASLLAWLDRRDRPTRRAQRAALRPARSLPAMVARSPRINIWRCGRCSRAICWRRRAIGCSWRIRSRADFRSSIAMSRRLPSRCRPRSSCTCSMKSTCSSARRSGSSRKRFCSGRSSRIGRPMPSRLRARKRLIGSIGWPRLKRSPRPVSSTPPPPGHWWTNAGSTRGIRQFSNSDNMAIVGMLSTQCLYDQLVRRSPGCEPVEWTTNVDVAATPAGISHSR